MIISVKMGNKVKFIWLTIVLISILAMGCTPTQLSASEISASQTAHILQSDIRKTQYALTSKVKPSNTPDVSIRQVRLVCPECAELGIKINLWESPSKIGVAGSVPHNTTVTVLDTTTYDGVLFYKVNAGGIVGWVTRLFIQNYGAGVPRLVEKTITPRPPRPTPTPITILTLICDECEGIDLWDTPGHARWGLVRPAQEGKIGTAVPNIEVMPLDIVIFKDEQGNPFLTVYKIEARDANGRIKTGWVAEQFVQK